MQKCPLCGTICEILDARVDVDAGIFLWEGGNIELRRRPSQLLQALFEASPRAVSKGYLMDAMYGLFSEEEEPDDQILTVYVYQLRKKLTLTPFRIKSVWGDGYRLIQES